MNVLAIVWITSTVGAAGDWGIRLGGWQLRGSGPSLDLCLSLTIAAVISGALFVVFALLTLLDHAETSSETTVLPIS